MINDHVVQKGEKLQYRPSLFYAYCTDIHTLKKSKVFHFISLQVGCFEGVDHNREEEEEATPQSSSPGINFLSLCELLFIPAPILF